jgi:hypothetical protein
MRLPFKIVIDSRASNIMGNSSDFSLTLPETIHLEQDSVCYVNSATCTNTFLPVGTVIGAETHYVYFFEKLSNQVVLNRAVLPSRTFIAEELSDTLQDALNTASVFGDQAYTCTFNDNRSTITISRPSDGSRSFLIVDDDLMKNVAFRDQADPKTVGFNPYTLDWNDSQTAFQLFGLGQGSSANTSMAALLQLLAAGALVTSQETGCIDVRKVHNVYVHSEALSNHNVIGRPGSRSMLTKIPVLGNFGDVLHRAHSSNPLDFIDTSNQTLSTIDISLRDAQNRILDIRGGSVTIELLFASRNS